MTAMITMPTKVAIELVLPREVEMRELSLLLAPF
jgi:hypothetical protein